jgi:hypothetical protein
MLSFATLITACVHITRSLFIVRACVGYAAPMPSLSPCGRQLSAWGSFARAGGAALTPLRSVHSADHLGRKPNLQLSCLPVTDTHTKSRQGWAVSFVHSISVSLRYTDISRTHSTARFSKMYNVTNNQKSVL